MKISCSEWLGHWKIKIKLLRNIKKLKVGSSAGSRCQALFRGSQVLYMVQSIGPNQELVVVNPDMLGDFCYKLKHITLPSYFSMKGGLGWISGFLLNTRIT